MLDKIKEKINNNAPLDKKDILKLIALLTTEKKQEIYNLADNLRAKIMGDEVFIRAIIEFSNFCRKNCDYCGIRGKNKNVKRYRMTEEEIIDNCLKVEKNGFTTVVLQSGEDMYFNKEKMGYIISEIKAKTKLAITVSAGERDIETYKFWYDCGMDRYLLRFETSNKKIFQKIHPDDDFDFRIQCIKNLKSIGVQTGSGFMIGLPEASFEDIADDILLC
ncbi:MAG TPA: radical SAM protein, partial [bacterium]|nr:radical SAM protein [bacterium]